MMAATVDHTVNVSQKWMGLQMEDQQWDGEREDFYTIFPLV